MRLVFKTEHFSDANRDFALQIKAYTSYRIVVKSKGAGYTVMIRNGSTNVLTIIDNKTEDFDSVFFTSGNGDTIHLWSNDYSKCPTIEIYEFTELSNIITVINGGTKIYEKQYSPQNYICDIKKGDIITVKCDALGSDGQTTCVLYNNDSYESTDTNNLILWNLVNGDQSFTFVSDKDYKYIRLWQNVGVNRLSIIKEKETYSNTSVELNPIFRNGSYYNDYSYVDMSNRVCTQIFGGIGLFMVSFPDDVYCRVYRNKNKNDSEIVFIENSRPFSIISDGRTAFVFVGKNGSITKDSATLSKVKIWYIPLTSTHYYDVVVSAYNSKELHKHKSNIVCDGTNDTDILACLFGCIDSIRVLLYGGKYNISKMWTHSPTSSVALGFNEYNFNGQGMNDRRYIVVEGLVPCSPQSENSVDFVITKELHESLANSGKYYFLIGSPYSVGETVQRNATSVKLSNINIIGHGYDKPITYIDTTRCLSTMIDSVNVRSWHKHIYDYAPFDDTPNVECCGIRVGRGSDYGIQNYVKHSNYWYCGKGVACCGEHFIFEDVKAHHDYIGFVFGDRLTVGHFEHPNIMLGCSIESCYRMMLLTKDGVTTPKDMDNNHYFSTLIIIGLSTENKWDIPVNERTGETSSEMLPIKEIIRGCYRGRIEVDGWWNPTPFEQDGSGHNMLSTWYSSQYSVIRKGSDNVKFYI